MKGMANNTVQNPIVTYIRSTTPSITSLDVEAGNAILYVIHVNIEAIHMKAIDIHKGSLRPEMSAPACRAMKMRREIDLAVLYNM